MLHKSELWSPRSSAGSRAMEPRREVSAGECASLIAGHAEKEGCTDTALSGLRFVRVSRPGTCRKMPSLGPTLTVVGQGRPMARFKEREIEYDTSRYAVVSGETICEETVKEANRASPYLAMRLEISPAVIAKTMIALADTSSAFMDEPAPVSISELDKSIEENIVRLLRAVRDPLECRIIAPLVIEELVFRLLRSGAAGTVRSAVGRDRDAEKMQEAMRFLGANVERPLSVEDVARHVANSPSQFAHRFRAVAGVSPMRYLKQLRLQEAQLLLLSGLRVSEVAARVGYESASHFTRDFKTCFRATPGDYAQGFRKT
jgi:AraC-like DNA-binding protein